MVHLGKKADQSAIRHEVLLLSDDLSVQGGVRTRILGEMTVVTDRLRFHVVARVRARNIHRIREARDEIEPLCPGTEVIFVPMLPHGGLPIVKEAVTMMNAFLLVLVAALDGASKHSKSIYAHNLDSALAGTVLCRVFGLPLTVDLHGDEIEENISVNGWKQGGLRDKFWRRLQRFVIGRARTTVCVSEAHRDFLRTKYGLTRSTTVIPCCVGGRSEKADACPSELATRIGLCDKKGIWLFFSGSPFEWQLFDRMGEFFESLSRARPDCHFLLLISDRNSIPMIRREFSGFNAKGVQLDSVPHDQLMGLASKADIALLFREDVPLNNIASPTKFAEYLLAGLPVLLTPNIGDYSELVNREHLGKTVDLARISESSYVSAVVGEVLSDPEVKRRCSEYVLAHLTWESYRDELYKAFVGSDNA